VGLLAGIFKFVNRKRHQDKRSHYIFYKIVDVVKEGEKFKLQCINTNALFHATLTEIVYDVDILYGLHPIQACYIGIEYAKLLKIKRSHSEVNNCQNIKMNDYVEYRYGTYELCYQDRKGNVCFTNAQTSDVFLMDPRDIALSQELIQDFDATQAFHIGLFAGLKLNNPTKSTKSKKNHLRLVK
jgi:hypothetical protein